MNIFSIILIILCVPAALGAIFLVALNLKASLDTERLLKGPRRGARFITELLRINFSASALMSGAYLPSADVRGRAVRIDQLLVTRGGISVIKVKNEKGYIDNSFHGDWMQYCRGEIFSMRNPFEQNSEALAAVRAIIRRENIVNIPVHNIVVFTDRDIKFRNHEDMLLTADGLTAYIKDLNKSRFLSYRDTVRVGRLLRSKRLHPRRPAPENTGNNVVHTQIYRP